MSSRNLRGTQPPSGKVDQSSSASSTTSAKAKIPTDVTLKREASINKSLTPQSSSDDAEPTERPPRETRQTRQQKRDVGGLDGSNDKEDQDEAEDGDVDAEVTRCVCGRDEYPGPPVPLSNGRDSRRLASLAAAEGLSEDAGGLFISCDTCGVWQHGGCVGIFREEQSPDNYYCEQCREEYHRVQLGARGQRYSSYLPIVDPQSMAKTPRRSSATKDSTSRSSREADAKRSANMSSAKRRSTMNSRRDLEEEEMLRKAIEQSKSDEGTGSQTNGQRRSKRGREEDSDEARKQIKRQKTRSNSGSPPTDTPPAAESSGEEDNGSSRLPANGKTQRGAATLTPREREAQERERQKNAERQEAAGRRSGRADRRRVDESETTEEPTRPPPVSRNSGASKHPRPQTSSKAASTIAIPTTTTTSHKKKPSAKKGRVGRNQYTKDRETAPVKRASPQPPNSRGSEDAGNGNDTGIAAVLGNGSKPSKPRHMNPNRTSMNDLRKRAAGILEYITRTQMELANTNTPSMKDRSGSSTPSSRSRTVAPNGTSKLSSEIADAEQHDLKELEAMIGSDESTFKKLDSVQMMDVLTRGLVMWQQEYGKWGEKS